MSLNYEVPKEYYYRIHHIRPRFKDQVENVLVSISTEIANIGRGKNYEFRALLNDAIRDYPGNQEKTDKTINNWRTEISSLFGLFIEELEVTSPGLRAIELAEDQDLRAFFKKFLYSFEYPGGHLKNHEIVKLCQKGIHFNPAQYIIQVMDAGRTQENSNIFLTTEEVTHCIFNDLRVTRDQRDPLDTWKLINANRDNKMVYDSRGDTIRYAGDIIDYMVIANILILKGHRFMLNYSEKIVKILKNTNRRFEGYMPYMGDSNVTIEDIRDQRISWFKYVNESFDNVDFSTDILQFLPETIQFEKENIVISLQEHIETATQLSTAIIGLSGETLVVTLEKEKLYKANQEHLLHLVNFIPTALGVGYDIQSFESDGSEIRRYIEVKTTVSSKAISFNSLHITQNEWRTIQSVKDRYFIYRLAINEYTKRLYIIPNVYGQIQKGKITVTKGSNGYDLRFVESAGFEEMIY